MGKNQTVKLLEENKSVSFPDPGSGNVFLDMTWKAEATKGKKKTSK